MTKETLQALIDRVIGKDGILRAPAWWVRRLFSELLGYTDTAVESAKEYTDTAVSNIEIDVDAEISDTSENPVQNKVVKTYVDNLIGDINTMLDTINGEEV